VTSEIVISPPDEREGYEEVDGTSTDRRLRSSGARRWRASATPRTSKRFDRGEVRQRRPAGHTDRRQQVDHGVRRSPQHGHLPGSRLRTHAAAGIARVNDCTRKDFGTSRLRRDSGELDRAFDGVCRARRFQQEDLNGTLGNVRDEVGALPEKYAALLDLFREIKNPHDRRNSSVCSRRRMRKEFKDR